MQLVSDSGSDSSNKITVGTTLVVLAGQVQYFPCEACLYYKKNVMFENECLCSVLAFQAFPSPPATFQEYSMNHDHVMSKCLLAKFFHAAATVRSLSGLCQQLLSPGQDYHRECWWRDRVLHARLSSQETRRLSTVNTTIADLTKWPAGT